ncbi:putative deoxyribonuclease TATDN2 [Bolinopsis microptera]|uniref:putative deoxyribonuclease TATDN2 n=1 Tax=Bolinopsis microptera TaxID=2820187 RepID=UPI00307A2945
MYDDILKEDGVWAAFGLHPHNAKMWCPQIERDLIRAASHPKCVAWGEMGLDYGKGYTKASPDVIEMQKDAFMAQIKQALKLNKPFVIHARGAEMDAFEIMKTKAPKDHKIHFHCYSGSWKTAEKMMEHFPNMYIGVTGLVTFNSATNVTDVARKVPLERLLIETDAPYMRPKNANLVDRNSPRSASPSMGIWVAARIAEIRKITLDIVLIQVRKNVANMYGI